MKTNFVLKWSGVLILMPLAAVAMKAPESDSPVATPTATPVVQPVAGAPPQVPRQEAPEALTRGPVHAAFAEPVAVDANAGVLAPSQPPADICELPPAEKPQGSGYVWAPGYWNWDSERKDFIWISGCWRLAPPGATWMPGSWVRVTDGWRWVEGYWNAAAASETAGLPAPPAPFDCTPPGTPPTPASVWVPGCWYWSNGAYVARPGYWLQQVPGWIWQPSHYEWTPGGYVFVAGYWDYDLEQRGLLFAPVAVAPALYSQPDYVYTPSEVVDLGAMSDNLFVSPDTSQYYYGDYYAGCYPLSGIYPCFACLSSCNWCDPIFCHRCWWNGLSCSGWLAREQERFGQRVADPAMRPASTFAAQQARLAGTPASPAASWQMTRPLAAAVADPAGRMPFERVSAQTRQALARQAGAARSVLASHRAWNPALSRQNPAPTWLQTTAASFNGSRGVPSRAPESTSSFRASAATRPPAAARWGEPRAPTVAARPAERLLPTPSFTTSYRPSFAAPHAPTYSAPAYRSSFQAPARSFASSPVSAAPAARGSGGYSGGGGSRSAASSGSTGRNRR